MFTGPWWLVISPLCAGARQLIPAAGDDLLLLGKSDRRRHRPRGADKAARCRPQRVSTRRSFPLCLGAMKLLKLRLLLLLLKFSKRPPSSSQHRAPNEIPPSTSLQPRVKWCVGRA